MHSRSIDERARAIESRPYDENMSNAERAMRLDQREALDVARRANVA